MVSSGLSWSEHVNVNVNKANKLLGLAHKNGRLVESRCILYVIQISCAPGS